MLVLSRKVNEGINYRISPDDLRKLADAAEETGEDLVIAVAVVRFQGDKVRLGSDAPKEVRIVRAELEADAAKAGEAATS